MKKTIAGVLFCFLTGMAVAQESGYRTFKAMDGRSVYARIVAFDAVKGRIQFERTGGKRIWVEPDLFSGDDQAYIRRWIAADRILSRQYLRISIKKEHLGTTGSKKSNKVSEKVCFHVTLDNRSKSPIDQLKIEYRYFIHSVGSGKRDDKERSIAGSVSVEALAPKQRRQINTKIISLDTEYITITEYSSYSNTPSTSLNKVREDELRGIWIKIYGPLVDGVPSVRDVSYPEDLKEKVQWK